MAKYLGIDVSKNNGVVQWDKVEKAGAQFAIIKATEGHTYTDPQLETNNANCKLPKGFYHYMWALSPTESQLEANFFLSKIKGKEVKCGAWLDVERNQLLAIGKKALTDCVIAWLEVVKASGVEVGIYTNKNWALNYLDMSRLKGYKFWYARYTTNDLSVSELGRQADVWQYASDGKMDGITSSGLDMNIGYFDFKNPEIHIEAKSDTNADFSIDKNASYQFKITASETPVFAIGTPNVFISELVSHAQNDYYYRITAIGDHDKSAGIYLNGKKVCVVTIKGQSVISDTTDDINVKRGKNYQFKLTSITKPNFVCGNGNVFRVDFVKQKDKDYFFKVIATGNVGEKAGFYINNEKLCVGHIV